MMQEPDSPHTASNWLPALAIVAIVAAAGAYLQLLLSASANVPYLDDFDVILDFLNRYVASDSATERIGMLFEQHVEHRMAFLRELAVLSYHAQGGVDFATLNLLGSLGLGVLAALLYRSFLAELSLRERIVAFTPAPLLLFHPQFWDCLLWPTSSLANFWVVAFALATLQLLTKSSPAHFLGAGACALAAVFSQGNGMLALLLGAIVLGRDRRIPALLVWSGASVLVLGLYFAGYVAPEGPGRIETLLSGWEPFAYALNFIGSAPSFTTVGLAAWLGAAGLVSTAALIWRGYPARNLTLFGLLIFILASIAANALGRSALAGPLYPLHSPRYQFFSCVFWAVTYLAWVELLPRRPRQVAVALGICSSLAFSIASFALYRDDVERISQRMQRGMLAWTTRGRGLVYPNEKRAGAILQRAIDSGAYRVPIGELMAATPLEVAPHEAKRPR